MRVASIRCRSVTGVCLKGFEMNFKKLGALALAVGASSSFAAVDITAATTGIGDAQTAVLGVLAVMITMAAAVFGVKKVLKLIGR